MVDIKFQRVPKEIIDLLIDKCQKDNTGFAQINTPIYSLLIVGEQEFSANQISLIIARDLINGVLNGHFNEDNEMDSPSEEKVKLN